VTGSKESEAAAALIHFLNAPASASVIVDSGMEPLRH
jgi:hypothetical protein